MAHVEELGVANTRAPGFVVESVENAQQVYADLSLPIEITNLELRDGEVLVEGIYR